MEKLYRMLSNIINRYLNEQLILNQWKVAYISSMYKKRYKKDSSNYRRISVTSKMSRLYSRILSLIEKEYSNREEEQSGFKVEKSYRWIQERCTDNIFCLKQVIEKMQVYIIFVDLQKPYYTI